MKNSKKEKVYKDMAEAVSDIFFTKIVQSKPTKITKNMTLADFCKDKRFKEFFPDTCVDLFDREFGVSIRAIKNKPVLEILKYVELKKKQHSIHGRRF